MRPVHGLILYTVLLHCASRVQGTINSRRADLGDAMIPDMVDSYRRPSKVGRRRHLSQTRGKKRNEKEDASDSADTGGGKSSTDALELPSVGDSADFPLASSKAVKAMKKSLASDKSSVSRLRMSKDSTPKKSKKAKSNMKRRKSIVQSRSMNTIRRTAAPASDSVESRDENESFDETFVVEESESMDEASPPTAFPTISPTTTSTTTVAPVPETAAPTATPRVVRLVEDATASYEFNGEVPEPTGREVYRLELATTAFYLGVFSETYAENSDTTFVSVVANAQETRYNPQASPPIDIDWEFQISFGIDSVVIPTSEEVLDIIYADEDTLNDFVSIYLQNGDDIWTSVTSVTFDEGDEDAEDGEVSTTPTPTLAPSVSVVVESTTLPSLSVDTSTSEPSQPLPQATSAPSTATTSSTDFVQTEMKATIMLDFLSDGNNTLAEPSQDEYDQLASSISLYFIGLLTEEYLGSNETTFATATATITDARIGEADNGTTLQANFNFDFFFSADSTDIPTPDYSFELLKDSEESLESFLQGFAWDDDMWNEIDVVSIEPLNLRRGGNEKA